MRKSWEGETLYEFKSTWKEEFKSLLANLTKPLLLIMVLAVCVSVNLYFLPIRNGSFLSI
jgi:hypothetical protein